MMPHRVDPDWVDRHVRELLLEAEAMSGCAHMNPEEFCASCAPVRLVEANAEVARLRGELRAIDEVLARRPALDLPTRAENIEKAINVARLAEERGREIERLRARLAFLGSQKCRAEQAEARLARVVEAASALVEEMAEIQATPEYRAVWTLAHIHGQPYTGRNWKAKYEALQRALATAQPEEKP